MPQKIYTRADIGDVNVEKRTVPFVVSTESLDAHGTIVRQDWRLERFLATGGPILWAHDRDELPIGRATRVEVRDGHLEADVQFAPESLNPHAEKVFQMVREKFIRGASVGFVPGKHAWISKDGGEILELSDCELIEISITPTPSNVEALAQLRSTASTKEPHMTIAAIIKKLGVEDEARAVPALDAILADRDILARAAQLAGGKSGDDLVAQIAAWKSASERLPGVESELSELRATSEKSARDALVKRGLDEGKLTAALVEKLVPSLSTEQLRSFLDVAPVVIPGAGAPPVTEPATAPSHTAASRLSAEDRRMIRELGVSEDEYLAAKAASNTRATREED